MSSNKLLLNVARGLRYQPLKQLVGLEVTINSLDSISDELAAFVHQNASLNIKEPDDIAARNRTLACPIGKYGLLDFEHLCDANITAQKTGNVQLLRDLGFLPSSGADSKDLPLIDDDPEYCIRQIRDEITQNQTWLKLFFHTTDPEFGKLDFATRFRQSNNPELIRFPMDFRLVDACLTNAPFVWFNRHFYI